MAEGFNFANLYSPTTDTDSFKLGIVLSAQYGLILTFFDVSNVFQTKFIADPQKYIASVYLLYIKNGLNIDSQIIYYVKKIPINGKKYSYRHYETCKTQKVLDTSFTSYC